MYIWQPSSSDPHSIEVKVYLQVAQQARTLLCIHLRKSRKNDPRSLPQGTLINSTDFRVCERGSANQPYLR